MNIRTAENIDKEKWDAFVLAHPEASPYHLFAWKEAVEDAYGHKGHYLMAEENGQLLGVLPLIVMRIPLLHTIVVSLPFCDVGGALACREDAAAALHAEALCLAENVRAKSLEIRSRQELPGLAQDRYPCSIRTDKVGMFLRLPESSEALWDGYKSKLRNRVRKAEKNDMVFSWGGLRERGDFYTVFSRNMRDLGSPVHSRKFMDAVLERFGAHAHLGFVRQHETPVGAGILLGVGSTLTVPWSSTLREYHHIYPNMLLYWHFLKHAADSGFQWVDFGRSTPGEGTYKFKEQWGAEPRTLFWHTVHLDRQPGAGAAEAAPEETSNRERLAALWARLPLWAANILGPPLRRYISL